MTKTLIGTATTDSSGKATFTYTGVGAGELDILAETEDGTLVSGTFTIDDTVWYDLGTDSTHSMFGTSSTMTVTYGNEYCTLSETTSGTNGVVVADTSHYIQPNDIFEFDFMQVDGSTVYASLYIRNKTNGSSLANITLYALSKSVNTWIHLKCQIIGSTLYVYVDDNPTPVEREMSNTNTDYRLYWTTPTDITELRFKNFKVYRG